MLVRNSLESFDALRLIRGSARVVVTLPVVVVGVVGVVVLFGGVGAVVRVGSAQEKIQIIVWMSRSLQVF